MKIIIYVVKAIIASTNEIHFSLYSTKDLAQKRINYGINYAKVRGKIYKQVMGDDFWEADNGDCIMIEESELHDS